MSVFVETKTLPETIQAALRNAGVNRPTVRVEPRETDCMRTGAYGDGYQGFTLLVDIDSGRMSDEYSGSWGGENPFCATVIADRDETQRPVPPNACIIHGNRGGGKPASATLVIHPSRAAKLLRAGADAGLTARERTLLGVYAHYNSRGRSEWFGRHGNAEQSELDSLTSKGLIKVNKAGSVTITANGRNVAPKDNCYWGWLTA